MILTIFRVAMVFGMIVGMSLGSLGALHAEQDHIIESSQTVTLYQALKQALSTNPDLQYQARNIDLAATDLDNARAGYRPNVALNGGLTHQQNHTDASDWQSNTNKMISLDVEQSLYTGGQVRAAIDEQEFLSEATRLDFEVETQSFALDVVQDYMDVFRAVEAMRITAENVILLKEQYKATKARYEAGELTRTDVAQAEAELAQAKALDSESIALYEGAVATFLEITGINIIPDVVYPTIYDDILPETLRDSVAIGLKKNPSILTAKVKIKAQEADIREQSGAFYPQITAGGSLGYENDPSFGDYSDQESASFSLSASLPLYQGGVLQNQVDRSKILKSQAEEELESAKRSTRENIIITWNNFQILSSQLTARRAQLQATRIAYQGVKLEEEVGSRTVLDVLEANQDVRDAELSLVDVRRDRVNAYYQLLQAMGVFQQSIWDNLHNSL